MLINRFVFNENYLKCFNHYLFTVLFIIYVFRISIKLKNRNKHTKNIKNYFEGEIGTYIVYVFKHVYKCKILCFDPKLKQILSIDLNEFSPGRVKLQCFTNSTSFNIAYYF